GSARNRSGVASARRYRRSRRRARPGCWTGCDHEHVSRDGGPRLGRSGTCHEPAVDRERVSSDPGGIAGGKKGDCSGDVLRFTDTSERIEGAEAIGSPLLSIPVSGSDGCWGNSVHADTIGSQTGGKVDREGTDSCFSGRVRFAAQSGKGVDGADVDDRGSL